MTPEWEPKLWALRDGQVPGIWAMRDEKNARELWLDDPDLVLLHRENEDAPWKEIPREGS